MSLRYILGSPGTGKTETCANEIIKNINNRRSLIYIVPEQFSLQAEKNLVSKTSSLCLIDIQVLSFKRLAYHVFSETGMQSKKILEDTGKLMLIKKIMLNLSNKFKFFSKSYDKQGFIENIANMVSEFFQYSITLKNIKECLNLMEENSIIYNKTYDICLIYENYINYIKEEYISTDEILDILADKIDDSLIVDNSEIWIDGFNSFTPQEYKIIAKLFKKAYRVNIALCIDQNKIQYPSIQIYDPYYKTKSSINTLNKIAGIEKIKICEHLFLNNTGRYSKSRELCFLKDNYFTSNSYLHDTNNITILGCQDKYSEISTTADNILKAVRKYGLRFKEIGVILSDSNYEKPLKSCFSRYNIPFFIDTKKDISYHPLSELITSSLNIITTNFNYESVFTFLKTGLFPMETDEINLLENYVLAHGIKGYLWRLEKWEFGFEKNGEFEENDINYFKDYFMDYMDKYTAKLKSGKKYTVEYICTVIFELLNELNVTKRIAIWINNAEKNSNSILASEHKQVWELIVSLFDKTVEILGNTTVTVKEFSKIIKSGFSAVKLGLIPSSQDEIIVGNFERTRFPNIKALFILGANDTVLPSYQNENPIYSDIEKDILASNGIELSENSAIKTTQEQLSIYQAITKPSEYLYISYAKSELDGRTKRPSSIINKIMEMFPNITEKGDTNNFIDKMSVPAAAFEEIIPIMQSYSHGGKLTDDIKSALKWFGNSSEYSERLKKALNYLFKNIPEDYLNKKTADKLYSSQINASASRFELFSKCPFAFFVQYGLKAKQRRTYTISAPDMGSMFHLVIEKFSKEIEKENIDWKTLSKDDISDRTDRIVDDIIPEISNNILLSSSKYKHLVTKIKNVIKKSIWALSKHIKAGNFKPLDYEIGFGPNMKLPPIIIELNDKSRIVMTGKIDRVDILDYNGKSYVKIIDYKSGQQKLNLSDLYYGLQLQLALYLDAFINSYKKISGKNLLPGGMFYFIIDDPLITAEKIMESEELENELLKAFKLSGLVLNNIDIIKNMDNTITDYSKIIPVRINKNNEIVPNNSSTAIDYEFENIRKFAIKKVKEIGGEIKKGNIKILPFKSEKNSACDYCIYKTICKFESIDKKDKYRKLKKLDNPINEITQAVSEQQTQQ